MSRQSTAATRRRAAAGRARAASRRQTSGGGRSKSRARRRSGGRGRRLVIGFGLIALLAAGIYTFHGDVEDTVQSLTLPLKHEDIIRQQAEDKDVPADLIAAVIYSESRFRDQTSSAGARGLMQLTPQTAAEIEKLSGGQTFTFDDLADPDLNIRYGTFYLRHLLDMYDGNEVAAIAAYNAGPGPVAEWGGADLTLGDIRFEETRNYVHDVLDKRKDYRETYGKELGF